jgi:hypothetical protein
MSQTKYRAQILLEPEQHQILAEIAAQRQESISLVVREIVQEYLVERDLNEQQRREIQAIQSLAQLRQEIQAQHGLIHTDLLAEARAERDAELDERGELIP